MLLRRITQHGKDQNWFAVGIDFLIVVVGILLAFQITEWNEARKDRLREGVYLNRIAVELDESIASIEDAISLAEQRAALGELLIRAAGILTLEQIQRVAPAIESPEMTVEEALAAHARTLERPAFIEWLPLVAYRGDDLDAYSSWLESAENLRSRIRMTPGFEVSELEAERP